MGTATVQGELWGDVLQAWITTPNPNGEAMFWQPRIFDCTNRFEVDEMYRLIASGNVWRIHDTLEEQICELIKTRMPHRKHDLSQTEIEHEVTALLDDRPLHDYGRWVYYPWSGRLIHLLPPAQFRELRLNRNHYKITPAEQERLANFTVGIVGLSVGNAAALTIAMEEACGHLKLADFDQLSLSNMNRIRTGVQDIGLHKTVIAARQIFELNPYANISLFHQGLTEENMAEFLQGTPPLDILVDECDSIRMKLLLREKARALCIPVLMETGDRGMIDVERFDLEPQRPIFHGYLGDVRAANIPAVLTDEDKVKYALPILGIETISTRFAASLVEIEKSISTWPQLGEDIALGGAIITAAVRRLALGESLPSGRRFVDLIAIIGNQSELKDPETRAPKHKPQSQSSSTTSSIPNHICTIVEHGILAPSGGNCQPWRFTYDGQTLYLQHDLLRSKNLIDPEHRAGYIALGAAIENMVIAATKLGFQTEVTPFPYPEDDSIVASLYFEVDETQAYSHSELYPQIKQRVTNRHKGKRVVLPEAQLASLAAKAEAFGCQIHWLTREAELAEISNIMGEGDRLRFLCAELHEELMSELRWDDDEVQQTRDGIDVASLELTEAQSTALRVIKRPDVVALLRQFGHGQALSESAQEAIASASAVGLVSIPQNKSTDILQAGRGIEQLWLQATQYGLALHPMTTVIYMFEMLTHEVAAVFKPAEQQILLKLKAHFADIFPQSVGAANLLLFRLSHSVEPPTVRSLRMPIEQVLHEGSPSFRTQAQTA